RAKWIVDHGLTRPRRTSDKYAGSPGVQIALAERGSGKHEGMPRASGGSKPGWCVRVMDFEQHGAGFVAQADAAVIVGQTVRAIAEGPQNSTHSVNGLDLRGRGRDDEEAPRGKHRV